MEHQASEEVDSKTFCKQLGENMTMFKISRDSAKASY
jgi:hypothetical protein